MTEKKNLNFTFPYEGWVLTPSYAQKKITLVNAAGGHGYLKEWHVTDAGRSYHHSSIYETKEQAIAHGHSELAKHELRMEKMRATLEKRRKNLMAPEKPTRSAKNGSSKQQGK